MTEIRLADDQLLAIVAAIIRGQMGSSIWAGQPDLCVELARDLVRLASIPAGRS